MIIRIPSLRMVAVAVAALASSEIAHARPGPDVVYSEVTDTINHGQIGNIRAYSIGTATCNIGDQNLLWTSRGTPTVGFNLYQLRDGRLTQIGLGFCKTACCALAGSGCGLSCNGRGGTVLGIGCRDIYSAGINAAQSHLAPRSAINAYSGMIAAFPLGSGDAIFRRVQVPQAVIDASPTSLHFVEGIYVATDDAQSGNAHNNASHRRVAVDPSSFNLTLQDATVATIPAIQAWRDHGLGANTPDPSVTISTVDVPDEGRFWIATKVTEVRPGTYLYDYAIYNFNSHASGGSLSIPLAPGIKPAAVGFHDVAYHSGEVYDNTDWTSAVTVDGLTWSSPQTFDENPNSNALRWGTMYNFWFEADAAPALGQATLGLFRPNTPQSITFDVPIPGKRCQADWNEDDTVTSQDFFDFLADFFNNNADFNGDAVTDSQDFFDFLSVFFTPC